MFAWNLKEKKKVKVIRAESEMVVGVGERGKAGKRVQT